MSTTSGPKVPLRIGKSYKDPAIDTDAFSGPLLAVALPEIPEEASMACRDTQSQRSPSEERDVLTNPVPQGGTQATASPGRAREHWDRLDAGVIRLGL
jgi:hypothetical protein